MDHVTVQGTDKEIKAALLDVNLPNLLLSMYCITGDRTWIAEDLAPAPVWRPRAACFLTTREATAMRRHKRFEHQQQRF